MANCWGVRRTATAHPYATHSFMKAEIVKLGQQLGVPFGLTSTCYDPGAEGQPCGRCDACLLRLKGFREAEMEDPLPVRARERGCMKYAVKELYYTLQGEGINVGRPAVFLRFAGCNLWSGLEKDRGKAICQFCDTDFVGTNGPGGGLFTTAHSLARAVASQWPTNGEPTCQAVCRLHRRRASPPA